jgi:hypothetical protein
MPKVHHPYNALDTMKDAVESQLGQNGVSMTWEESEYCDRTFVVWIYSRQGTYEYNLKFYPEFYAMTASSNSPRSLTAVMKDKFDEAIYY